MEIFIITWSLFVEALLPMARRQPKTKALADVLLKPVKVLYTDFTTYMADAFYRLNHNSQKVYMEAMLNDRFDTNQRRIRIVNTVFRSATYFYEQAENREVFHYEPPQVVFYREVEEFAGEGVDFTVCVPPILQPATATGLTEYITRMRGLVDYYKLYSKNYNIVWVQVNG